MKKTLLLLFIILIGFSAGCSKGEEIEGYEEVEGRETLTIGMECNYAPFNWSQPRRTRYSLPIVGNSQFADGYDIQVVKHLARELQVNVRIKAISWEGLEPALNSENIDLIIAGMSPTEDRKQAIDFTDEYYRTTHVVMMKKNAKYVSAKKLTDFHGARGVGQIETIYDSLLAQLPGITHQSALANVGLITTALKTGTADIAVLEKPVAQAILKLNKDLIFIELEDAFVVTESEVQISIGIRKGREELKTRLNQALSTLTEEMRKEWMTSAVDRQILDKQI